MNLQAPTAILREAPAIWGTALEVGMSESNALADSLGSQAWIPKTSRSDLDWLRGIHQFTFVNFFSVNGRRYLYWRTHVDHLHKDGCDWAVSQCFMVNR